MSAPPPPPGFEAMLTQHPASFLGPFLAASLVQCLQMGAIIVQTANWSSGWHGKRWGERLLVLWVVGVATAHTTTGIFTAWKVNVVEFGNFNGPFVTGRGWPDFAQATFAVAMAAPVQFFLIWKVTRVTHRRWLLLVPLLLIQIETIVWALMDSIHLLGGGPPPPPPPPSAGPPPPPPIDVTFLGYTASTAALDLITSGILVWYLVETRTRTESDFVKSLLDRILSVVWRAAIPPCLCAFAGFITFLVSLSHPLAGFWHLFFSIILGNFYVISLLVTLNSRETILSSVGQHEPSLSAQSARKRRPHVAINVSVETQRGLHYELGDVKSPTATASYLEDSKFPSSHRHGGQESFFE